MRFLIWIPVYCLMMASHAQGASRGQVSPTLSGLEQNYEEKLKKLATLYANGRRPSLSHRFFSRLDWVERTALLNVVCAQEPGPRCDEALRLGLSDNALLVRDHALRLQLQMPRPGASQDDVGRSRRQAVEQTLADDRNYRRGQGLWIVERARKFLELEGQ